MVRLGFIIGFIALIGVLLSGLAAYRVHEQELAIDGIALSRAIDVHASLVQDRLTERELLARVASGLFRASSVVKANMLQPLRSAIYAFKTDFVTAFWIARLKPADLAAAQAELKSAGFTNPTIRDFDDRPLDIKAIDKPLDVLMDLEPRSADTLGFPGRAYDRHSVIGPMLVQAAETGKPVASDPIPLLRQDGPIGIVLASPVLKEGTAEPAGFITFSYELSPLMLTNDDRSLFSVVLKDPDDANDEYVANDQGVDLVAGGQAGRSGAVGGADGDVRRPRLVARLLCQEQCRAARAADGDHRGGHRLGAHRHRLRPVRLCRLQQSAAQPRDPGPDRFRAAD